MLLHLPLRGDRRRITLFGVLRGVLRGQVTLPARATLYGDRERPERRNPGGGGGGGGKKGWASKPNDVERLHAPATRQWAQD